ncbi:S26 family signal peptidase, partial [Planococcus sp. CP5-4_YE]|uniref:S26 family signal peptidase n=1 Tax=Planococcus sp. CP5-4_YE TaxID=2850320 RepID=UPI00349FB9FF
MDQLKVVQSVIGNYPDFVDEALEDKDYIKRIIGVPGDHIAYENDQLYINGEIQ